MIFFLGLLDLITGVLGLTALSINALTDIASYAFMALLLKGVWSVYTGKSCIPILLLGLLDLITAIMGLLAIGYNVLTGMGYILSLLILFKGFWTTFTTLFQKPA